jgi:hypothetical protein
VTFLRAGRSGRALSNTAGNSETASIHTEIVLTAGIP